MARCGVSLDPERSRDSPGLGPPPDASHSVLSCRGLNRVIDHAVDDLTITVEAGLPLQDLQDLLAEQG